jgi:hypothetical protein
MGLAFSRTALLIGLLLAVQACVPPRVPEVPHRWARAGSSYDDFLKDRYACIQDARSRTSGAFVQGGIGAANSSEVIRTDIFLPCMAARGWREDPAGFEPPPGGAVRMR